MILRTKRFPEGLFISPSALEDGIYLKEKLEDVYCDLTNLPSEGESNLQYTYVYTWSKSVVKEEAIEDYIHMCTLSQMILRGKVS